MNEFSALFEKIKKQNNIPSDLQLAKFLGMSQNMVHRIMKGISFPGDETCVQIARVTGYDPAYVLALAHKCAAKQKDVTKEWDRILKLVPKGVTLGVMLTAGVALGNPGVVMAMTTTKTTTQSVDNYILSDIIVIRKRLQTSLAMFHLSTSSDPFVIIFSNVRLI